MSIGSDVDLVNLALSHLGDVANVTAISPSDGSVQADHAGRFYAQMRDWLTERFAWKFATTRASLPERSDITVGSWAHVYDEPNDCLRILAILPGTYTRDTDVALFDTEADSDGQGIVLTDAADAVCRYIARVTDVARFSPGYVEALSWFLAAALAGPIIKGETGRQEALRCAQMGTLAFASATQLSAIQAKKTLQHMPGMISARGQGAGDFTDVIGDAGGYPIRSV